MSTPESTSQSSPVKKGGIPAVSRKQITSDLKAADTGADPDFVKNHLNVPRTWKSFSTKCQKELDLFSTDMKEQACYDAICSLLNKLSDVVHAFLKLPPDEKLVFLDHHAAQLRHHPDKDVNNKPDFIAVRQFMAELAIALITATKKNLRHVPWHRVESVGEWKGAEANGLFQCTAYAGNLNRARPDQSGAYGLSASINDYQVIWSDASGHPYSQSYTWDDTEALVGYVFSLYRPADGHIKRDLTISLSPFRGNENAWSPPKWNVTFNDKSYLYCQVIFVGAAWSRMTWVVRSENMIIIKDSYQGEGRNWTEADLFAHLHGDGIVPGWVQVIDSGSVLVEGSKIMTTGSQSSHRTKERLVMSTSGDSIYSCPSLLHFLHVMYDVLEAHRWAVVNKRILHRDLSISNILINPSGGVSTPSLPDATRPKFIREVLNEKVNNAESTALICDLDNGRKLGDPRTHDANHLHRTGTPMYISRSVSIAAVIVELPDFFRLPDVPPALCPRYGDLHPEDALRKLVDKKNEFHGGTINQTLWETIRDEEEDPSHLYDHLPRHDAESIYWVIVAFLLRALPDTQSSAQSIDINEATVKTAWQYLQGHQIGQDNEAREGFLKYTRKKWRAVLHEQLAGMAELLADLSAQVKPEYAYLDPPPSDMHLHEAMQRVLLKYIYDIDAKKTDILLNPNVLRDVEIIRFTDKFVTSQPSSGSVGFSRFLVPRPPTQTRASYSSYTDGSNAESSGSKRAFDDIDDIDDLDLPEQAEDAPESKRRRAAPPKASGSSDAQHRDSADKPDLHRKGSRRSLRVSDSQKGKPPVNYKD